MTKLMFEFGRKILAGGKTEFESDLSDGSGRVLRELLRGMTEPASFEKIHRTGIGELIAKVDKGGRPHSALFRHCGKGPGLGARRGIAFEILEKKIDGAKASGELGVSLRLLLTQGPEGFEEKLVHSETDMRKSLFRKWMLDVVG